MKNMDSTEFDSKTQTLCDLCYIPIESAKTTLSCKHSLCLNCLSLCLIKTKFESIKSDKITFRCFCKKGKAEYETSQFMEICTSSDLINKCIHHHKESNTYCKTCECWICDQCNQEFHNKMQKHELLSKKPMKRNKCILHNQKLTSYCKECKKELCEECEKEKKDEHKEQIISINEYAKQLLKKVIESKQIKSKEQLNNIIRNKEQQYRKELLEKYNEKKCKIERLIKLLQETLIKMKSQFDIEIYFSSNLFNILDFVYDNYFNILSSNKSPISLLDFLHTTKEELHNIDISPVSSRDLDKIFGKIDIISQTPFTQCKFEFLDGTKENEKTLSFPTYHQDFMSSIYKVTDSIYVTGSLDKTIRIFHMDPLTQELSFKHSMTGHNGSIQCFTSFDDTQIASGSYDCTIKIWNLTEHKLIHTFEGHKKCVRCLLYIPMSSSLEIPKLLSGSDDCTIRIWNLKKREMMHVIENMPSLGVQCMLSLYGGKIIVAGNNNGSLCIYEGTNFEKVKSMYDEGKDESNGIATICELENYCFVTGDKKGWIRVYDPQKIFECVYDWEGHKDWVSALVRLNKQKIVSGGRDEEIKIWEFKKDKYECIKKFIGHTNTVIGLNVTKHQYIVSGGVEGFIKVWKESFE